MNTISYDDFLAVRKGDPYYAGRWAYFKEVITLVRTLDPSSVLELGPYKLPIVLCSDTMDKRGDLPGITFNQDARTFPWPIQDKTYDLFIALQVWEHLNGNEGDVFREVMRVSKAAILSFPYMWPPSQGHHAGIDENKIAEWTLHVHPRKVLLSGDKIIYFFVFSL